MGKEKFTKVSKFLPIRVKVIWALVCVVRAIGTALKVLLITQVASGS